VVNTKQCFTYYKIGHFASQCRDKTPGRNNFNGFTRPPTSYNNFNNNNNGQRLTCTYCSKLSHDISTCYNRRNDEQRTSKNESFLIEKI
jgi:hypothetical protein